MYERIQPDAPPDNFEGSPFASGNRYFADLDELNELFGAGPSGTTGTALTAAFTFGGFDPDNGLERVKEYLFAVIGYLVGGGMHTLTESLAVCRLLGMEYHMGSLSGHDMPAPNTDTGRINSFGTVTRNYPLLPALFLGSPQFANWRDEYYDIVVLGGTHWRFNSGPWSPGKTISNSLNR
jgi:hypothetical protein